MPKANGEKYGLHIIIWVMSLMKLLVHECSVNSQQQEEQEQAVYQ